jgi:hypothetical protein
MHTGKKNLLSIEKDRFAANQFNELKLGIYDRRDITCSVSSQGLDDKLH